jgi:hypothetical protein
VLGKTKGGGRGGRVVTERGKNGRGGRRIEEYGWYSFHNALGGSALCSSWAALFGQNRALFCYSRAAHLKDLKPAILSVFLIVPHNISDTGAIKTAIAPQHLRYWGHQNCHCPTTPQPSKLPLHNPSALQ